MSSTTVYRRTVASPPSPLPQALLALAGGVALFFVLLVALIMGYDVVHAGKIFPGVSVAGIDVSGMQPRQAAVLLSERLTFAENGRVAFQDGKKVWMASPSELGLFLDPETSALNAYSLGRQGNPVVRLWRQFDAWYTGIDLPPVLVYDERRAQDYVRRIAGEIDLPTVEATLTIKGTEVVVNPGQIGRTLNVHETLAPLQAQLGAMTDMIVPLAVYETPPVILDVKEQADLARSILSQPLTLRLPNAREGDPGPWTFEPDKLAKMLTIERVESAEGARYQVGLTAESLRAFLEDLAPKLARDPANARFIFNDDSHQLELIQSAVIGRRLDVDATIRSINEKLVQGEHTIDLSVNINNPQVGNDATAEQLGIRELVSQQTSFFFGSNESRIQNIKVAAARFHGVLVPPGATFSMAEVLGDVSLDTGFAEALIIYGNRTIKGVGGGVCQVSTTLFRTVFFGGYPVVERYPHAYRVGYYEQVAGGNINANFAGLDATVFVPVVDFKFTNDTSSWLLMETYTNVKGRSLTWKFYSTSDGRSVDWDTTGLQNIVEPPDPQYIENPDLDAGETRQVDWAVEGADVTVSRTVLRDGGVYFQDQFVTHYMPWRDIIEYGPGTRIPKDKNNDDE